MVHKCYNVVVVVLVINKLILQLRKFKTILKTIKNIFYKIFEPPSLENTHLDWTLRLNRGDRTKETKGDCRFFMCKKIYKLSSTTNNKQHNYDVDVGLSFCFCANTNLTIIPHTHISNLPRRFVRIMKTTIEILFLFIISFN